jgi:hypothetical protein
VAATAAAAKTYVLDAACMAPPSPRLYECTLNLH